MGKTFREDSLCDTLEIGAEKWRRLQQGVCYRVEGEIRRFDLKVKRERKDPQANPLSRLEWPLCSQVMSNGVGDWDKGLSRGKEVWRG